MSAGGHPELSLDLHSPMDDTSDGDGDDAEDMGDTTTATPMTWATPTTATPMTWATPTTATPMTWATPTTATPMTWGDADDMGDTDGGDADDMGDDPMALPDTGSGGLAGDSSLPVLPLALAISIVVALGGVMAVRRTRA